MCPPFLPLARHSAPRGSQLPAPWEPLSVSISRSQTQSGSPPSPPPVLVLGPRNLFTLPPILYYRPSSPGNCGNQEQGPWLPSVSPHPPQELLTVGAAGPQASSSPPWGPLLISPPPWRCRLFPFSSKGMRTRIRAIREKPLKGKAGATGTPDYHLQQR